MEKIQIDLLKQKVITDYTNNIEIVVRQKKRPGLRTPFLEREIPPRDPEFEKCMSSCMQSWYNSPQGQPPIPYYPAGITTSPCAENIFNTNPPLYIPIIPPPNDPMWLFTNGALGDCEFWQAQWELQEVRCMVHYCHNKHWQSENPVIA